MYLSTVINSFIFILFEMSISVAMVTEDEKYVRLYHTLIINWESKWKAMSSFVLFQVIVCRSAINQHYNVLNEKWFKYNKNIENPLRSFTNVNITRHAYEIAHDRTFRLLNTRFKYAYELKMAQFIQISPSFFLFSKNTIHY